MLRQRPMWYFEAVQRGVPGTAMSRWDYRLAPADAWDVAFYVWSLSDGAESLSRGRVLYERECSACHGHTGNAEPAAPLAGANRALLSRREVVDQILERHAPGEVELAGREVIDVAAYVWTLLYEPLTPTTVPPE